MYLTYDEYCNMGGTLDEPIFNSLEMSARMEIDNYTFKRLAGEEVIPDEVKECMYLLIDLVNKMQAQINSGDDSSIEPQIKSQSNDGVSISYNVLDAGDVYTISKNKVKDTIKTCLFKVRNSKGHRLTYRGIYEDE